MHIWIEIINKQIGAINVTTLIADIPVARKIINSLCVAKASMPMVLPMSTDRGIKRSTIVGIR